MGLLQLLSVIAATAVLILGKNISDALVDDEKFPTVGISILVKNKAHTLPSVLTCLEQQDYPKDRIYFWFYVDHTTDHSMDIIRTWTKKYKSEYNRIIVNSNENTSDSSLNVKAESTEWTKDRLKHIIILREKAIKFARDRWVDYILMIDADVFLTEPQTLQKLVKMKLPIVAPMLITDGLFSNFWAGMTSNFYYLRTEEYERISNREVQGCFEVPMVHTAVLIDLRLKKSELLTYDHSKLKDYDGPIDDIIAFALSAKRNGVPMSVCNDVVYGFLPIPVDMSDKGAPNTEQDQYLNAKLEALAHGVHIPVSQELAQYVSLPLRDRLGVDEVFMINLERRSERRRLMDLSFKELGVEYTLFKAFDGTQLDVRNMTQLAVTLMPKYEDPYHKRPMKMGEIGCFLSHYHIWKQIAKRHIKVSLILEDDIHFAPYFRRKFTALMDDLSELDWELVYIGRKVLQDAEEEFVTPRLSRPLYSYWTLGYLLSEDGARKLLRAEPLSKMLPVDEFLPIMFDQHPNETWKSYFGRRELKAFSAAPLLVQPTHYTGQDGYVSDTEDSSVLPAASPSEVLRREGTL